MLLFGIFALMIWIVVLIVSPFFLRWRAFWFLSGAPFVLWHPVLVIYFDMTAMNNGGF